MAKDWIERGNLPFREQARAFSQRISDDPSRYGIDPADAALLASDYAAFDVCYRQTWEPLTRTTAAVIARDRARKALSKRMRALAAQMRANPAVTDAMRRELQMTVDGEAEPTPQHPPKSRPWITIVSLINDQLTLSLKDSQRSGRGVPRHYSGAQIFMHPGERVRAPLDLTQWRLVGVTSKARTTITLPMLPAGSAITLAARWYNSHGAGPSSQTTQTYVGEILKIPSLQGIAA
jgi:hypothetical protein